MNTFSIHRATEKEFDQILPLIVMAIEDLANQFTNTLDETVLKERMQAVYNAPETRFSMDYALVIKKNEPGFEDIVCGAGFAYPGKDLPHLTLQTIRVCESLGAVYKSSDIEKLLETMEAETDEYYIDNLAIYEAYRGFGLSKKLIEAMEEKGQVLGFEKISILADVHNPKAKSIYNKLGYMEDCIYSVLGHEYDHLVKTI